MHMYLFTEVCETFGKTFLYFCIIFISTSCRKKV